jgi:RNA polymerase sigma-70 factor (ECF subfamily)
MTGGGVPETDDFAIHRDHLLAVAYRMLGSRAEAEDAVQEAWLRYATSRPADLADPRGWLTTVTARICLDVLRSARVRRESYVGQWLPEPVVSRLPSAEPDPADRAARTEEVSLALLVVLERLTPEQRVAFVLHDVFAVPFEEIAEVLGITVPSARQLASRGRRAVAGASVRHDRDRAQQQRVLAAFLAAAEKGDIDALLRVLAPEVVAIGDGGGVGQATREPVTGALRVARFMIGLFRQARRAEAAITEPVLVNGDLGMLAEVRTADGREQRLVMAFAVADGRVTAVFNQVNPDKLTRVPPARG